MRIIAQTLAIFVCSFSLTQVIGKETHHAIKDRNQLSIKTKSLQGRKTFKFRLDNGIKALIIQDPNADQSAISIRVDAGQWNDPDGQAGMAHFCEHMLFMGTKSYPEENSFSKYVHEGGGMSNAYTATDHTVYMLRINHDFFKGGVDRISEFFINPLFNKSCVERELLAVNQENDKNKEHDSWRHHMVLKERANKAHPFSRFSTGNKETVSQIPIEDLRRWFQHHYSSDKTLVVAYTALPIADIRDHIIRAFSRVPVRGQSEIARQPIFSKEQKGCITYIKPVQDHKELDLIWEFSAVRLNPRMIDSGRLVAAIFNDNSENSLSSYLQKKHWISSLGASFSQIGHGAYFFNISASLTEDGLKNQKEIIHNIYEQLNKIQTSGISKDFYSDTNKASLLSYEFQSRRDPFHYVSSIAEHLGSESIDTYPTKTILIQHYSKNDIQAFIKELSPSQAVTSVLAAKPYEDFRPTHKEQWLGGEYSLKPIAAAQLKKLASVDASNKAWSLPKKNPYMPDSLTIAKHQAASKYPKKIFDDVQTIAYHHPDLQFHNPEIVYNFSILSPALDGSSSSQVKAALLANILNTQLSQKRSIAARAGLKSLIHSNNTEMLITISGYDQKAPQLLSEILHHIKQPKFSEAEFITQKSLLLSQYQNMQKELAYRQGLEVISKLLFSHTTTANEAANSLNSVSYQDMQAFASKLFMQTYMRALISGNITENNAMKIVDGAQRILNSKPFAKKYHYHEKVLMLPTGKGPFKVNSSSPMIGSSTVLSLYFGPFSFEDRVHQKLLTMALKESFFDTLRTKQQTGYINFCYDHESNGHLYEMFLVQSTTHSPDELIARYELFLEDYVQSFDTHVSKKRFEKLKTTAIKQLQMPSKNLTEEASFNMYYFLKADEDFQRKEKAIKAMQALSYDRFKELSVKKLSRSNTSRIAALVYGKPVDNNPFIYQNYSIEEVALEGRYLKKGEKLD